MLKPHTVPNVALARFGTRHLLRLFLPGLYDPDTKSGVVDQDHRAILYDQVIRLAVAAADPLGVHDWPTTFSAEVFRSRKPGGGYSYTTKALGAASIRRFSYALRDLLRTFDWGKKPIFMVQVQGTKAFTAHSLDSLVPGSSQQALEDYTRGLRTYQGEWWIDVALEFVDGQRALLWRSDAHHIIIGQGAEIPMDQANHITRSSYHAVDPSSHLTALAGFRTPMREGCRGPHKVAYMQAYTTDKSQTYHQAGFLHSKALTVAEAMKGEPPQYLASLIQSYNEASGNTDVAARLEVRVPLEYATLALQQFSAEAFCESVVSMQARMWW